ncbi:hypothetical protein E8E11_008208 [Didymella keratinophila]|nr:hypothetical protein E8E11_008208 [Didymella keratinophila]
MSHVDPAKPMVPFNHTVAPLTADFARGWRKLPDELKVKVLSYNLVYDVWIHGTAFLSGKDDFLHGPRLRHHLALRSDFALATQVFYEKNVINSTGRSLPPVHVRKFVREMVFIPTIPWNMETVY